MIQTKHDRYLKMNIGRKGQHFFYTQKNSNSVYKHTNINYSVPRVTQKTKRKCKPQSA